MGVLDWMYAIDVENVGRDMRMLRAGVLGLWKLSRSRSSCAWSWMRVGV
jgi:hypothetical protein